MATTIKPIRRYYGNFAGVDFSNRNDEVALNRSPNALNMWKNYKKSTGKCVESRPNIESQSNHDDSIFGHFFYTYKGIKTEFIHAGKNLYLDGQIIWNDMEEHKSISFIFNEVLYVMDSKNYLKIWIEDGDHWRISEVEGYIPTTVIGKSPTGEGTKYQDVNLLTPLRKNSFVGDGKSVIYTLDTEKIDSDYQPKVWVNDIEVTNFLVTTLSKSTRIIFTTPPSKPDTDGQDNVVIQFKKEVKGYRAKIENCTIMQIFDNRVFFAGNPNFPNKLWHSSLSNPEYVSDLDYYDQGFTDSAIKAIIPGNNGLWTIKSPSQSNTTIFYLNPTTDDDYGKVYPSQHSSITTGCKATGINFLDDIVFLSDRGLEAISQDITTQQVLTHRSTFIDSKLLNEENYENAILKVWEGYLLIIIDNHIYIADSRQRAAINDHTEYEWFYWEFDENFVGATVEDEILYLYTEHSIYTLTDKNSKVKAYWTTVDDEFGLPQVQKTTNKKGFVADVEGTEFTISVATDDGEFKEIKELENTKGYIVTKIKEKKWKSIQIKFSSNKPFGIYSCTLEVYSGAYIKR